MAARKGATTRTGFGWTMRPARLSGAAIWGRGQVVAYGFNAAHDGFTRHDNRRRARKAAPQRLFGGLALAGVAFGCVWIVYANVFATSGDAVAPPPTVTVLTAR